MNLRPDGPKEISQGIFRLYRLFSALSAPKTILFGTLICICSECSETVSGQLCGQQGFPQNNIELYASRVRARGDRFLYGYYNSEQHLIQVKICTAVDKDKGDGQNVT